MRHFVEIRSYNLKPGSRQEFHRLFLEAAMPLLQRWNVDVVAYGPSLHDEGSYYLMSRWSWKWMMSHSRDCELRTTVYP